MATLFHYPKQYLPDRSGEPMMGAKLWFYEIGTSTPKDTYTSSSLLTVNSNPVVADAYGILPQIWLDDSGVDYRVKWTNASDEVQSIIDGLVSSSSATALLDSIKTVDGAGSGLDADLLDGLNSTDFAQLAQAQTVTGLWDFPLAAGHPTLAGYQIGYRDIPVVTKTAQYTIQMPDRGKLISITTGGILIPVNSTYPFQTGAFPGGSAVCVYNNSGSNQTIAAQTPATTTLRIPGTATTGSRTLAQRGLAVLLYVGSNEWLVYGPGVS